MSIQEQIITSFFSRGCRTNVSVTQIQGDASSRQYFRVRDEERSLVACYDPLFEGSSPPSYPFLVMHDLCVRHGIAVPAIMATDPQKGLLLLEDCGDFLLQNLVGVETEKQIARRYREIIDLLLQFQAINGPNNMVPFSLSFDKEKLMFEFDFFIRHALQEFFAPRFNQELIPRLRTEFASIAEILVKPQHFVLNHRDFHSRNILVHHDKAVVIDFQDARMGLAQYDAVSLIRDSYVQLNPSLTEELKAYHYNALRSEKLSTMSYDEYLYYFDIMAFQRNIKAIGTFCYQTCVKKNNQFEHSIAPTLRYLPDYIEARVELKEAGELLRSLLEGVGA